MASRAQRKMTIVCLMLLAVVGQIIVGMAVEHPNPSNICTETVIDPRVPNNECICSKNCACAGKCILESADAVQTCFVDCVLKNDCICSSKIIPGADDPKANAK
ncbi:uncharacterized protein [Zea mays]|jgi:hypothetical protein|uniref:Uncharacterized protein n=1 Tax=Zea mays TaxID=4577 RepID=K7TRZ3_MAIZE|nr:uncharacterized protein LOC103641414 [Zea mays]AQK42296.1 hypothetical protein ZEAMMB73_Zm00001d024900 [Zea mays]|eukprot:XP_008662988.1 uncharacterized protein LOC103641414 [Zea mays]